VNTKNETAAQLLVRIREAKAAPMLRMVKGGDALLDELAAYIEGQELRWTATNANLQGLARIILTKHYGIETLGRRDFEGLERLARGEMIIEAAPHG
jgi:hypothetical protein